MTGPTKAQLFLDCDGVLADFNSLSTKIFGTDPRSAEDKLGSDEFWRLLREHEGFYAKLPLLPDARELFKAVEHLNPAILTGCPHGGWAEPQKVQWAAEHFPNTRIITCRSFDKRLHMKPGDILVDDFTKYQHLWEEAGGIFVHHTSAKSSIAALKKLGVL